MDLSKKILRISSLTSLLAYRVPDKISILSFAQFN